MYSIIDSPDHSVVLEVKAAEIIRSNAFLTEYTLRFPRVVKIRYDKDWNECLDEEDLFKMIQMISQTKGLKRIKQGEGENEDAEGEGKDGDTANKPSDKKRGGRTAAKHYGVMSQFTDTDTSQVTDCYIHALTSLTGASDFEYFREGGVLDSRLR